MKEIVVISGKGGTGKTSIVAAFAALAQRPILVDCDVDAADLHLVIEPRIDRTESFTGDKVARIRSGHCTACGKCEEVCRYDAIYFDGPGNGQIPRTFRVEPMECEGCGVCHWFCDYDAIAFEEAENGRWCLSETRHGPMIHAQMNPGAENSGKLVSLMRIKAKEIAEETKRELILIDGSPGIGCPVIASITGADMVVIVTEPTQSGLHDFRRVADLAAFFKTPASLIVNKWDLNHEVTEQFRQETRQRGLFFAGRIPYDSVVTDAQIARTSIVEFGDNALAAEIKTIWNDLYKRLLQN